MIENETGASADSGFTSNILYGPGILSVLPKKTFRWKWDVFGGNELAVLTVVSPPWWRRLLARIILGSRWRKIEC